MSDLKHKSVPELEVAKTECETYIAKLSTALSGQHSRLEWINNYIYQKTPKEMSIADIEHELGHRIIIK